MSGSAMSHARSCALNRPPICFPVVCLARALEQKRLARRALFEHHRDSILDGIAETAATASQPFPAQVFREGVLGSGVLRVSIRVPALDRLVAHWADQNFKQGGGE